MSASEHHAAHKLAEMILHTEPGKAIIGTSAGLLVAAAPIIAPVVAVVAVTTAATVGVAWGIGKLVGWAKTL